MEALKSILELVYYISGVGLLVGVGVAIKQLKVVKDDFKTKNKRASIEKSIDFLNWFATDFIPESQKYDDRIRDNKDVLEYNDSWGNNFEFNEKFILDSRVAKSVNAKARAGAGELLNQIEYFSAALNKHASSKGWRKPR